MILSKEYIVKALKLYFGAVVSLLPGIFLGTAVLIPWYLLILLFVMNGKISKLIEIFVVWNFLNRGAFHYHLLGADETAFLIRFMNIAIIIATFILLIKNIKKPKKFSRNLFILSAVWTIFAFISAILNDLTINTFVQYYVIYFRWFLFAVVMLFVKMEPEKYEFLIALLFVIVGANGIIAFFQQFLLPVQVTPTGYIPSYFDLASGILGVTFSQHLTALTMSFATYFLIRYFTTGEIKEFWLFVVFMVQAFSSSSKAFLIILGGLIIITISTMALQRYSTQKIKNIGGKVITIIVALILGIQVYDVINENEYGGIIDPVVTYTRQMSDPESIMKIGGYITAFDFVAPSGKGGILFGVGPTKFLNVLDPDNKSDYSTLILRGNESEDLSTVDKQDTEIVANLGELGILGIAFQIVIMGYVVVHWGKLFMQDHSAEHKSLFGVALVLSMAVFIFAFYTSAWSVAFYYIPLFVFIGWQQQLSIPNEP